MASRIASISPAVTMRNKGYSSMEAIAMALRGAIPIDFLMVTYDHILQLLDMHHQREGQGPD